MRPRADGRLTPMGLVRAAAPRRNVEFVLEMPAPWRRRFWQSVAIARLALRGGAAQKLRELAPLIALLADRELQAVVEIGTAAGGTFAAWCKLATPSAIVVSIDLPGGPFSPSTGTPELLRRYGRPGQDLRFLRANSHVPTTREALVELLQDRPVDFLFIDGDHTYDGVRRDFEQYAPLVRPGGLIALHDVVRHPPPSRCEVERFWNEASCQYAHRMYIDRGGGDWGGIGVVRWSGIAVN